MRFKRNLILLLLPYLVIILINESVRPTIIEKPYQILGLTFINSNLRKPDKCTWVAHNDTNYCKKHHVKYLKNYLEKTDVVYFGIIKLLHSTGNYGAANIIFLVILFPLIMWYSLVKIIDYWFEIKHLKKK
jgi:hypothetical protein